MNFYKVIISGGLNVRLEANNFVEAIAKIDLLLDALEKKLIAEAKEKAPKTYLKLNTGPGLSSRQKLISVELSEEILLK